MANDSYGSVSRCRVYIDYHQYLKVQGAVDNYAVAPASRLESSTGSLYDGAFSNFNPHKKNNYTVINSPSTDMIQYIFFRTEYKVTPQITNLLTTTNYYGLLGHNIGLAGSIHNCDDIHLKFTDSTGNGGAWYDSNSVNVVGSHSDPRDIGYSLFTFPSFWEQTSPNNLGNAQLVISNKDSSNAGKWINGDMLQMNAFTFGRYFDLPVNANLSVNQTFSYDGVQTKRTFGGADLTQVNHTRKKWGDLGAWTHIDLSEYANPSDALNNEDYSTAGFQGKRSWDLAWSFISKEDMFPMNFENNMSGYYSTQQEVLGDNLINNGTMANFGAGFEGEALIDGSWTSTADVAQDWKSSYNTNVTVSKVTGNGFTGNAQRLEITADDTTFHFNQVNSPQVLEEDTQYKLTFKYRSNSQHTTDTDVNVGYANFSSNDAFLLPTNTGDAVSVTHYFSPYPEAHDNGITLPTYISFSAYQRDTGTYLEVSDIEVREVITPSGTWFDSDDGVHKDNIVGNFLNYTCFGTIPFIFQPDNTKTTFAICVLDKPSISIKRVAPDLYNIKMKIVEI